MNQSTARKLAHRLNELHPRMVHVATTEDALRGRWEETGEWLVTADGAPMFREVPEGIDLDAPGGRWLTVVLPGLADSYLQEGSFFGDADLSAEQRALKARYLDRRAVRRAGRGYSASVTLQESDWARIADYLFSLEGAMAAGVRDSPDPHGRAELAAVRRAMERIDAALKG